MKKKYDVLLVDDEHAIREIYNYVLEIEGYNVHTLDNAESAIEYYDSGNNIDVLVSDVDMTNEGDGIKLAEYLRKNNYDGTIILMSGNKNYSGLDPSLNIAKFLKKPVGLDTLINVIKKYI